MTLRHIRIFEAVCDCGCNTTKAAEKLHVTQPAVSLAISELENYYGIKLFDRISRRLYLSEAGKTFLEYSKSITLIMDDLDKHIRSWESQGVLRVGSSISIGSMLMPEYTKKFRETHPDIRVKVKIDRSDVLQTMIAANQLDFALIEGTVHDSSLKSESIMDDRLALIAALDYDKDVIGKQDLYSVDMLLREKGSGTREVFETVLSSASYPVPDPLWESVSTTALINAAKEGFGVAAVPYRMAKKVIDAGEVKEVKINGVEFKRNYKIIYHKDKRFTPAAKDFIDILKQEQI